ncbi:hypothetical protein D3C81_1428570 [compost metagenome]
MPGDYVAAVGQCGNGGIFLCAVCNAIDEGWPAYLHATGVIALGVDVIGGACSLIAPRHDVTAIFQSREGGLGMIASRRIDADFAQGWHLQIPFTQREGGNDRQFTGQNDGVKLPSFRRSER